MSSKTQTKLKIDKKMENELHKLVEIEIVVRFVCVCAYAIEITNFFPSNL